MMQNVSLQVIEALHTSWQRAWAAAGASGGGLAVQQQLLACYSEPHRKYHTLQHLAECVATLEPALHLAEYPGEVEVGLWFHDAIYDVKSQDNELKSAVWAENALVEAGVPAEVSARVRSLVLATRHAVLPSSIDEQLLVDVDLSILGSPPPRFEEYEVQVRQEYAWVHGLIFRRKRRAVLQEFLRRPYIYSTANFRNTLEAQARENLKWSIERLGG